MTRRDPYSWTVVRLPERDLSELVLELAAPLLERLGPAPCAGYFAHPDTPYPPQPRHRTLTPPSESRDAAHPGSERRSRPLKSPAVGLRDEKHFRCQQAATGMALVEMTRPDKPNSRLQR